MKICSLVIAAFCIVTSAQSQLYNNGATIKVSAGAVIFCTGNVTNAAGTITNDGKIEVQGNFVNSATYNTTTSDDSLLLTGTGAVTLNAGASTLTNLQINKTGGGGVTLVANANVGTKFEFLAGTFSTDPAQVYELIAPFAATFTYAAGTEVIGKVRRNGWANGSAKVFNGTNMIVSTAGGTAPTSLLVNMVPNGDPTGTEREVKRTFAFTPTGGTGYTSDVRFPYKAGELNTNTETTLAPWYFTAAEWNAKLEGNTVNAGSDFVSTTAIPAATLAATPWKLADPNYAITAKTFLRGAWNAGTGLMNTNLNTGGIIPLAQPYNVAPFNYAGTESVAAIPNANVVDWVLLELRKPASGLPADATAATVIGRKAVFLLRDGSLADLNGTPIPLVTLNKQGASFIVVRHRNHLGVMSNSKPSNAAGTFANDFSLLASVYKSPSASSDPIVALPSSALFGLWAGNANTNTSVNAADVSVIKAAIAASATGYVLTDINLSNSINAADASVAKGTIASSGSSSASRSTNGAVRPVVSSVPE
jgi:hypothetical protein